MAAEQHPHSKDANSQKCVQRPDLLVQDCYEAIVAAREYATSCMKSGDHWSGEVRSNVTITSEYVQKCASMSL